MAAIGKLAAILTLNSQSFTTQLGKASRGVKNFEQQLTAVGTAAKLWLAGTAVTALNSFVRSIDESLDKVDQLAKTIRLLGADAVEFQGLQFAASMAGVDEATFNMSAQRFSRRVGGKSIEATQGLAALGLDVQAVKNVGDLETQLLLVADAMSEVENEQERIAIAQKLFDSEGVKMVNLLSQGSSAIIKQVREAERSGLLYSEKTLEQAEKAVDDMTFVNKKFGTEADRAKIQVGGVAASFFRGTANVDKFFGYDLRTQLQDGSQIIPLEPGIPRPVAPGLIEAARRNRQLGPVQSEYFGGQQAAAQEVQRDRQRQEQIRQNTAAMVERFDRYWGKPQPSVPVDQAVIEILDLNDVP